MDAEYIVHGPKPQNTIPEESIGQQIFESLVKNQHLPAIVDAVSGKTILYGELLKISCSLANALRAKGIFKNAVIGILSENSIHVSKPLLATFFLGCTLTTFNPAYTQGELLHLTNISKPTVIFCSKAALKTLLDIRHQIKSLMDIVVIDSDENINGIRSLNNYVSKLMWIATEPTKFRPVEVDQYNDVAVILYSSGTTGLPKGVMLTSRNLSANTAIYRDSRYYAKNEKHQEVQIIPMPLFHVFGFATFIRFLAFGFLISLMGKFDRLVYLETIQKYKISKLYIPPSMAEFLIKTPLLDRFDISSVERVISGAAILTRDNAELLKQRFSHIKHVQQVYGMTETMTITNFLANESQMGSCGKLVPYMSAKILNSEGKTVGPGCTGQICCKGESIMKGYLGDPESTSHVLDKNGWFLTGDIGYYDENGFFYIIDRIKELIKYKSYQIAPAELESVLLMHPKIVEAAVIGIPHKAFGELPCAFIVKKPDCILSENEVMALVAEKLSPQKWLRGGARFVEQLPKTSSGKILKRHLREQYQAKPKL